MILSIRNIFPNTATARFNVTAWQRLGQSNTVLVGREVAIVGDVGEPDIGKLMLAEIDKDSTIVNERVIWEPRYESLYLEDPRAFETTMGKIVIGLTAVLRTKNGVEPFPAIVFVDREWEDVLPPVTLIQTFGPGKNLTPIGDYTYLFRPESAEYYHKLLLFQLQNGIPQKTTDIVFPTDIPWAEWRLGTTIPPLWLPNGAGILFIHGITKRDNKYIYSIGVAKITPEVNGEYTVKVSPEPLITPETFTDEQGKNLVDELRPSERRVVYACGGIIRKSHPDHIHLYVNVGDKTTFDVILNRPKLEALVNRL